VRLKIGGCDPFHQLLPVRLGRAILALPVAPQQGGKRRFRLQGIKRCFGGQHFGIELGRCLLLR